MKKLISIVFALIFCVMLCPTVSFSGSIRELSEEEITNMHRIFEEREWDQKRKSLESSHMLEQAVIQGDLDKAAQAIAEGANVNGFTGDYNIPLHSAVYHGHKEIVKLLLARGADVSLIDHSNGQTVLHNACFPDKPTETMKEIAELLIANGADVNARDASGETPLNSLVGLGGHKELAELLIEKGADINTKDNYGNTPIQVAVASGNKEMIELLIKNGADVSAKDKDSNTELLMRAVASGNKEMVESLIANGADVNAKDKSGMRALMYASLLPKKGPEIIELLLSAGVDVNARDSQGRTVLTTLEELESKFPIPNIRDEIIPLLKAHGATH